MVYFQHSKRFSSFGAVGLVVSGEGPSPAIHDPEGRFGCLIHLEAVTRAQRLSRWVARVSRHGTAVKAPAPPAVTHGLTDPS